MGAYSIRDLERLTGIKAHTIRIWEKRYELLGPGRTDTNRRVYSDEDVRLLLSVSLLSRRGYRISRIAAMERDKIDSLVDEVCVGVEDEGDVTDRLVKSMILYDETAFVESVENLVKTHGFRAAWEGYLFPFLERTGLLWITGVIDPGQEHFATGILRLQLTDALSRSRAGSANHSGTIIFFLPENELHELPLLYFAVIAAGLDYNIKYLGQNMPVEPLADIMERLGADMIVTGASTSISGIEPGEYIEKLSRSAGGAEIIVSGLLASSGARLPKNVRAVSGAGEFADYLRDRAVAVSNRVS